MEEKNNIKEYYNKNQILYTLFYSKGTDGIHYGFWEENTKTTEESIINTTKFVAKCLEINKNDKILSFSLPRTHLCYSPGF